MEKKKFDAVGIGNAIVDMTANVDDDFLISRQLKKGSMRLIDPLDSSKICDCIKITESNSGGSAANTIAGLASMGNKVAFIGKTSKDEKGRAFENSLKNIGVYFNTRKSCDGDPTAHCVVLITPDAQRTMNTCLGVAGTLGPDDIEPSTLADTRLTYIEGYLWDRGEARKAIYKAIEITSESNGLCAFSLSDYLCVKKHRDDFFELVNDHIDMLFANEREIQELFEVQSFDLAVQKCRKLGMICALTRSEKGSVVIKGDSVINIDIKNPGKVVDTTGAGDLYAAGFIHGYLKGESLESCGKIGSLAASEIIGHFGARPKTQLADLLREKGYRCKT